MPAKATTTSTFKLISARGTGSALVEAMLAFKNLPYVLEEIDYESVCARDPKVTDLNPLSQLPTLVLDNGSIMTESAAIALYLESLVPTPTYALPPNHEHYPAYLRWLVFIVAAIYPTFSYGDDPRKWIASEEGQQNLRETTDEHRKTLWSLLEKNSSAKGPWFFGESFTVIDIYIAIMSHWRPRRAWFQDHCPRLHSIATNLDTYPPLREVMRRNFTA